MKKSEHVFTALFIVALIVAFALVFVAGTLVPQDSPSTYDTDMNNYGSGWTIVSGQNQGSGFAAPNGLGSHAVISRQLPDNLPDDTVIAILSTYDSVTVSVDGQQLNDQKKEYARAFEDRVITEWDIVPIPQDAAGETLSIDIEPGSGAIALRSITLGSEDGVRYAISRTALPELVCIILFLLITLTLLVIALIFKKERFRGRGSAFACLALFILLATVWLVTNDDAVQARFGYNDVLLLTSYFSYTLMSIPMLMAMRSFIPRRKGLLNALICAFSLLFLTQVGLMLGRVLFLENTLIATHILQFVSLVTLMVLCLREFFLRRDSKFLLIVFGIICMGICGVIALTLHYVRPWSNVTAFYRLGVVLFVVFTSASALWNAASSLTRLRHFEEIINNLSCGICRITFDEHLSIQYANDYFYDHLGYPRGSLRGFSQILYPNDIVKARAAIESYAQRDEDEPEIEFRVFRKDGTLMWLMAQIKDLQVHQDAYNVVLVDITERVRITRMMRVREEEYRLATQHSSISVGRYDIAEKCLVVETDEPRDIREPIVYRNIPDGLIEGGLVSRESEFEVRHLAQNVDEGRKTGGVNLLLRKRQEDEFRWFHVGYTTIFDEEGEPVQAVISFKDITDLRRKEMAFKQWQQSHEALPQDSIKYYEYNLTDDTLDFEEGRLLADTPKDLPQDIASFAHYFIDAFIYSEDRPLLKDFLDRDRLLMCYETGRRTDELVCRRRSSDGEPLWTKVSFQLVLDPYTAYIKGFFLVQDIDADKRRELDILNRSQHDSLTGLLNRSTFVERFEKLLVEGQGEKQHAFIVIDIDGFKKVNDIYGHGFGDKVLVDIADNLKTALRTDDLIGRLGGDEFIVCLQDITYENTAIAINRRAQFICKLLLKEYSDNVYISGSLGISLYPKDALDFDGLYRKADKALYYAKSIGRNNYAFYSPSLDDYENPASATETEKGFAETLSSPESASAAILGEDAAGAFERRRVHPEYLLIVDDSDINRSLLNAIFKDDFKILEAADGVEALEMLKNYGNGVAVMLLDLIMPKMDGIAVLETMHDDAFLSTIPVIVESAESETEAAERCIELGATDFIAKPIDSTLVKIRVRNAITKRENDEMRSQNRYLMIQKAEENKYRSVLESTKTMVCEYDGVTSRFSYDLLELHYLVGNYDNRDLWQIFLEDDVASQPDVWAMKNQLTALLQDKGITQLSTNVRLKTIRDGERWFRFNVIRSDRMQGSLPVFYLVFNDINEEIVSQEHILYLAEFDTLTGIYNTANFCDVTRDMLDANTDEEFVLIQFDYANLKVVNDVFGRDEGDKVLKFTARKLAECVAGHGTYARVDADNFVVCLPHKPEDIRKLMDTMNENMKAYPLPFEFIINYGLYVIDELTLPVDAMIERAGLARQTVKGNYMKRSAYYDDALRDRLLEEQDIINQMDDALSNEEFEVYLQPKCLLENGSIVGAEALVRWRHPTRGVLLPGVFVPLFEKNGFITQLDAYVWEHTCMLLHDWMEHGYPPVPVSVNISRVDIYNPNLCSTLVDMTDRYEIPTQYLELEITESVYTEDPQRLVDLIDELHGCGFRIDMDDFGSGYSSLSILRDLPVDLLKIDMRFLSGKNSALRGYKILDSITRMAGDLHLDIVVEGVETAAQVRMLRSVGCEVGQGFYFHRPMPADEFEAKFIHPAEDR